MASPGALRGDEANIETTGSDVPLEVDGSMVRTNGLFHLHINGGIAGVITH